MLNKISPFVLLSIAALALITMYVFWSSHDDHIHDEDEDHEHEEYVSITPEQINAAGIEIKTVGPGKLQKIIDSPGKIVLNADKITHIHPKVGGIAIEARKNLGESVAEGELIALIESRSIAELKTAYSNAFKKYNLAQKTLQQEQNLHEKRISSLQDYQNSVNAAEAAKLDLDLAKQNLKALGMTDSEIEELPDADPSTLQIYEIRSPIAGTVLARNITPGEILQDVSEVFIIADLSNLWVEVSFYPHDLPYIRKGQTIFITDSNGKIGKAKLLYLNPVIDDETRRAKAIALLDNTRNEWNAGTYVTAKSGGDKFEVPLLITKEAVQKLDGNDCVFVYDEEGFEIRPVTLGRYDGKCYEVVDGLEANENYAAKNTFLLKAEHEKDEAEHMH